jgi:hypothetical protein
VHGGIVRLRHEHGHRFTVAREMRNLAALDPIDQAGQAGLGLGN